MTIAGPGPELFRPALEGLVPYEPGKPAELVQRELGLDRVVKLASNEGPFGPFPQALEAIGESLADCNRYPDGGAYRLRTALAARHGVAFEETVVAAGADAVIGYVCQATLDPGDEVVTPWPSFPSYVLDPLKLGATPLRVPLRDGRVDVDDLLAAVTPRTKLAYLPTVNNPTGTMTRRADFMRFLDGLPPEVLTVVDEAYFEYVDDPELPDAIEEAAKQGRHVLALRTFSKIYGLAGLRVGYGVGPADVVAAIRKVQRAFDVTTPAQEAALASLDGAEELARRRAVNRESMAASRDRPARARVRPGRPGGRELPLRGRRHRRGRAERRTAAPRSDRPADGLVRGSDGTEDQLPGRPRRSPSSPSSSRRCSPRPE